MDRHNRGLKPITTRKGKCDQEHVHVRPLAGVRACARLRATTNDACGCARACVPASGCACVSHTITPPAPPLAIHP